MKTLKILALLSAAMSLCAQTPSTVNVVTPTACLTSIDLTPMASGTLTVFAPGQNGAAAPFTSASGLVQAGTATRSVSGGRIVGSLVLPNPAVTSPTNVGYTFTITSGSSKTTYASVFISPDGSGNWNLCSLQAGNYQTAFPTVFTGGSFTGGTVPNATTFGSTVTLNADPTADLQAATKQYVDNHAGAPPSGTGFAVVASGVWGSPRALVSGDIPNNAANTSGSAGSLSAASAIPSGSTATTQAAGDNSAKLATDAFVANAIPAPNIAATCSSTQSLPFSATGNISYEITLSANCTFTITDSGSAGTLRYMTLIIHPAGFTGTLPTSSGTLAWSGGTAPTPSTSADTYLRFASTGAGKVYGNI